MKRFLAIARTRHVVSRAARVALILGTLLTLINQGDRLVAGLGPDWIKMALTYLVPYCVTTISMVGIIRERIRRKALKRGRR